ncbi:MAG: hypothetical protein AAGH78_00145 [Cyanobacteria bacterium P01_H01_bin.58]
MKIIRRFLSDIRRGENLDLYFFVVAALALAILNGLDLASPTLVESVTLALLGLLTAYSLAIRERLTDMQTKLTGTNTILCDGIAPDIKETLVSDARELLVIGSTLNRFTNEHYALLEEKVKNRQKIKILLAEPNSETSKFIPHRAYTPTSEKRISTKILDTLLLLCALQATAPDSVEIRTINFPLPFRCVTTNINSNNSSIILEYYTYKTHKKLPCVMVSLKKEPHWHNLYKTQILTLWNAGKEWTCQPKHPQS